MDLFKKILQKKIMIGIALSLPIFLIVISIVFMILMSVTGIAGYKEQIFNIFSNNNIDRSVKSFENTILNKEEEWNEKGVQIDKELVNAVILYGISYDENSDYSLPKCDLSNIFDCIVTTKEERRNKELIENAEAVIEGMVKTQELWSCSHYEYIEKEVCDTAYESNTTKKNNGLNNFLLKIITNDYDKNEQLPTIPCRIEKVKKNDPWNVCGYDDEELCKDICKESYDTSVEEVNNLKTKQEFITWLKLDSTEEDEYGDQGYDLAEKLKKLGYNVPKAEEKKDDYLNEVIDQIYSMYRVIVKNNSSNYFTNIGDPYNGDYTLWRQRDPAWANSPLGSNAGSTIGKYGCLITSLAIQIAHSKTYIDMEFLGADSFNPGTFVGRIRQYGAFTAGGSYIWNNDGIKQLVPNFHYLGQEHLTGTKENKISQIYNHLEKGHYLLLCVNNGGHWVAVTGITDDNITIIDPGYPSWTTVFPHYSLSGVYGIAIFEQTDKR